MRPLPCHHAGVLRRAMTLLELILVLAILAVVAGLSWPSVRQMLLSESVRQGAGQIRNCWGKARVLAMKTGRIYAFQYKPGAEHYRLQVWYASDDQLEASDSTGPIASLSGIGADSLATGEAEERLPEGVTFAAGETIDARGAQVAAEKMARASGEDLAWSSPIFFYPDGTASATQVVIAGPDGRMMQLDLRGLTGIARAVPYDGEEEPLP